MLRSNHATNVGTVTQHLQDKTTIIAYFEYILTHPIQETYEGAESNGLQKFTVMPNTVLVSGADKIVKHLNAQVTKTEDGKWLVLVKYPTPETLIQGRSYALRLKAKYVRGQLTFTAVQFFSLYM